MELTAAVPEQAARANVARYDPERGGFGGAPKFPMGHNLSFLLRAYDRNGDAELLGKVERALQAMADGGLHDHVGGGFHRYSTDREWLVPHFEKMLYDQALLARAYLDYACQLPVTTPVDLSSQLDSRPTGGAK